MPKKETLYICNICGDKYDSEEAAEKCEKGHYAPTKILYYKYDKDDRKKQYPDTITVKLKNGEGEEKTITYSRKPSQY